MIFQAISEFVRGNMEPCCWKFDRMMLRGITKQQKYEMLHTHLNNFPVFRNYRCIDFALNGRSGNKRSNLNELKFDVKFCRVEAEDFQATFHILLA